MGKVTDLFTDYPWIFIIPGIVLILHLIMNRVAPNYDHVAPIVSATVILSYTVTIYRMIHGGFYRSSLDDTAPGKLFEVTIFGIIYSIISLLVYSVYSIIINVVAKILGLGFSL